MAFSTAVKLALYNDALRLCGEQSLKSLTQEREARHYLDDVWPNAVDYCLEMGQWRFALRAVGIEKSETVTPDLPMFTNAFNKPEDVLRLAGVYGDGNWSEPLLNYREVGAYWWANVDPIYVQYVSNDGDYGGDTSLWTNKFKKYIAAYLATEVLGDVKRDAPDNLHLRLQKITHDRLLEARSHDAQQDPTRFTPEGRWVNSRGYGRSSSALDRGSRSRLIG